MKLNLAESALEVQGEAPRAIELRVSGRRVATLGADLADSPVGGLIRYRLPPAFNQSLRGTGDLVICAAESGVELERMRVRAAIDPDSGLRFTDGAGNAVVLNKWGHHSVTFGDADEAAIADLLRHTRQVVDELTTFGLKPWVMGGTLLGPVRSGALLPHDDDADIGYVSAHENPADVALESFTLQRFLTDAGHTVIRYSATQIQILFPDSDGTAFHVDVFGGFYRGTMFMQPFHVRAEIPRDTFENLGEIDIDGWSFPAPNPPERWLEANYGSTWRIPDAGHRFVTPPAATRRFHNWFGSTCQQLHFWDEYNAAHANEAAAPSPAARAFLDRTPAGATIYELAYGHGDDLLHLASRGNRLLGLDFSATAAATVGRRLSDGHPAVDLRHLDLSDRRQTLGLAIDEAQAPGAAHVFSANLLQVLTEDGRESVLRMVEFLLRRGGEWVASFPTVPAPDLSVDDPTTWHLTVSQAHKLIGLAPSLEIRFIEVGTTDRRIATIGVAPKGTL